MQGVEGVGESMGCPVVPFRGGSWVPDFVRLMFDDGSQVLFQSTEFELVSMSLLSPDGRAGHTNLPGDRPHTDNLTSSLDRSRKVL